MAKTTLTFETPEFYDLYTTCHAHGWKNLSPFLWDYKKNTLRFSALIEDLPTDIEAKQSGKTIQATITSHQKLVRFQKNKAKATIMRSLGLEIETLELLGIAKTLEPKYVELIKRGAGRLLRSPSLCGSNNLRIL